MTIATAEDELSLAERLFLDFVDAEELPVAAMVEASGAWEECRAFFLETLRGYAAGDIDPTSDGDAPLILIHLLGQQRERLAWLPLIALLRQDIDTLEAALGDALTDTLPRILVGVFDGDPTPLEDLLVDPSVDGSCRWSAFDAYIGLHVRGAFAALQFHQCLARAHGLSFLEQDARDRTRLLGGQRHGFVGARGSDGLGAFDDLPGRRRHEFDSGRRWGLALGRGGLAAPFLVGIPAPCTHDPKHRDNSKLCHQAHGRRHSDRTKLPELRGIMPAKPDISVSPANS